MSSVEAFVRKAEDLRDHFEAHWSLPWSAEGISAPVWCHEVVVELARLPDRSRIGVNTQLLEHPSFALVGIAVHDIGAHLDKHHVEPVRHNLRHSDMIVRALAAWALGKLEDRDGVELLLETRDDEHPEVKKAIVDVLRILRDPRCIPLVARWIGRVGEDDVLRRKACEALGEIGDDASMPVLSRVLADDAASACVAEAAAGALARIGGTEATALLLQRLHREATLPTPYCIEHLSRLGVRQALPRFIAFLHPRHPQPVGLAAAAALGRMGGPEASRHLAQACLVGDPVVRAACLRTLLALDRRAAVRLAEELCQDPAEAVSGAAGEVLTQAREVAAEQG